ncbi:unnamed protein product, partial [Prorocentrum cordatum]
TKAPPKLAPQNSAAIRGPHNGAGEFWMLGFASEAVQSSAGTGRECSRKAEGLGKGYKSGRPRGRAAASSVDGLATEMTNDADLPETQRGIKVTTEILKERKVQATHQRDAAMDDRERRAKVTFAANTSPCIRAALFKGNIEEMR